jgi:hypothetical protein
LYIIFRILCNLLVFWQVNLFKTAKHWDSFFTHCIKAGHGSSVPYADGSGGPAGVPFALDPALSN